MRVHLQIVGVLLIVFGAMFVLTGLAAMAVLGGIGLVSGKIQALALLGWIGTMSALFFTALGLPGIVVGKMLYDGKRSARIPAVVLAILLALSGAPGVLVAAYMLWVLFDTESRTLLGDPPRHTLPVVA